MMLNSQKYPNTSRTISGLINQVFTTDVLLFCDTSLGAVNLNLLEIPFDFWNTIYKLYVIDANNNASLNNITINAPTGYKINNASSFVINNNGGIGLIRIVGNNDYSIECNYGAGGLAVLDEGVLLTPNASSMNFLGGYVTASNVGNNVSVLIQPNVITLTYLQLQNLINNSLLIAGQMYKISDAKFIQTTGETAQIFVTAVNSNSISHSGQGYFFNADYQGIGNYSAVTGFVAQLGIWKGSLTPVVGDVVIWNNFHYKNISGNNSQPDLNPLDWTLLSKTITNGYIEECCLILYDVKNNNITQRNDLRENFVENNIFNYSTLNVEAFQFFQWGSDKCKSNVVTNNSAVKNANNNQFFIYNFIANESLIKIDFANTLSGTSAYVMGNSVLDFSKVVFTNDITSPIFTFNNITTASTITISKLADPYIEGAIAVNQFNQCILSIAPCSSNSTFYSNVLNGVRGSIINNFASFSFNSVISSLTNNFTLTNEGVGITQAIFNNNQVNFSSLQVGNNGTILENIFNSSAFSVALNQLGFAISKNTFQDFNFSIAQNFCNFNSNSLISGQFICIDLLTTSLRNIQGNLNVNSASNFGFTIGAGLIATNITTTSISLDISNPLIYDSITQTLTFPTELEFVSGIVYLINSTAPFTIAKIVGGLNASNGSMKFFNQSGNNVRFSTQAVGIAVADEIISNLGAVTFTIVDRTNGADSIDIRRLGNLLGVELVNIYI